MLPAQSGLVVLERLRRERPGLPVLILSARSELATKLRGFELGATDYLTKPFSLDELLARVRIQLRRFAPQDGAVLRAGSLVLDLIGRQVRLTTTRRSTSQTGSSDSCAAWSSARAPL